MSGRRFAPALPLAAVLLAGLVAPMARARAQSPRITRENFNAWFNVLGDLQLTRNLFLDYELSVRRHGPVDQWQQLLPRVSGRYRLHPNAQVSWGYTAPETWPYGKLPVAFRFPERRMWEQLLLTHAAGRVALSHRYRLEQRWLGRVILKNGEEEVEQWVRSNRVRYRAGAVIPLQGATLDDGEFYTNLNAELFVNWGANVMGNVFDQYRLNGMLGYRFSNRLRLEGGYLEQLIQRPNGRELERDHTLVVAVLTSQSLVR